MFPLKHCDVFSKTSQCFFYSLPGKCSFCVKKYNIPVFLRFSRHTAFFSSPDTLYSYYYSYLSARKTENTLPNKQILYEALFFTGNFGCFISRLFI